MNGEKSGMRGEKSGENGEFFCMDTQLQEKFRVINVLDKAATTLAAVTCTHEKMDWSSLRSMAQYAGAEMAKARIYEDLPARDSKSIGGFKHVHVRL